MAAPGVEEAVSKAAVRLLTAAALIAAVIVVWVSLFLPSPSQASLDWLLPQTNREFGIVESFQHGLLFGLMLVSLLRTRVQVGFSGKAFFVVAALGFGFLLLEEADYFMHFYDRVTGRGVFETNVAGYRNLHNVEALAASQLLAFHGLVVGTWFFALYRLWGGRLLNSLIPVSGWRAAFVMALIVIVPIAIVSGRIYPEDARQLPSEAWELALYVSWALMFTSRSVRRGRWL